MTITNIDHFSLPFTHTTITNFLTQENLSKLQDAYNSLTFNLKKTDLFLFYQTAALDIDFLENYILDFLNNNQTLYKFTKQQKFEQKNAIKVSFDIFASYYTKGNYLLPHDDTIDKRKIAFCLYLNDYDTGELIMYNKECDTEIKRINVKENLFVMFGVEQSYHEVNYCDNDGRMAITGWLKWDDEALGKDVLNNCFAKYINGEDKITKKNTKIYRKDFYDINIDKQKHIYKIEMDNDIKVDDNANIELNKNFIGEEGPFYSRKIGRITGSNVEISIEGYELVTKDAYKLRVGDYILINDKINEYTNNIIDIYYFNKIKANNFAVVKYVNENGEVEMELDCIDNHLYCIKRNNREIYVERIEDELFMEHFIYKKMSADTLMDHN